ncbi:MAG: hypothetical protein HGJ94_17175 [Desulfosarcina sp.]|nr:hypothetical protein [Desulfosarcina sp.]MBC2742690.1 hypothetical protein [Desulfosarcina sp.]MBC2765600.1 hypothetical protein [Desulfosarcina sp.]
MKSLHVNFNEATQAIDTIETASPEPWDAVCERFDNDVQRIMAVSDPKGYTALYACYDENNQPVYYLVEEGEALTKLRQKTFLSKLGQPQT